MRRTEYDRLSQQQLRRCVPLLAIIFYLFIHLFWIRQLTPPVILIWWN